MTFCKSRAFIELRWWIVSYTLCTMNGRVQTRTSIPVLPVLQNIHTGIDVGIPCWCWCFLSWLIAHWLEHWSNQGLWIQFSLGPEINRSHVLTQLMCNPVPVWQQGQKCLMSLIVSTSSEPKPQWTYPTREWGHIANPCSHLCYIFMNLQRNHKTTFQLNIMSWEF